MKGENLGIKIGIGVFVIICSIAAIYSMRSRNDIKTNGVLVNVRVVRCIISAKGSQYVDFECEFIFNGLVKNLVSASKVTTKCNRYVGSYFPALYSVKYDAVKVLITNDEFTEYGLEFPDSIRSKLKLINK